jgi:hypothetical protein
MTADPIMDIVLFDPLAVITIKVDGDTIQVLLINLCFPGDTLHWPLLSAVLTLSAPWHHHLL